MAVTLSAFDAMPKATQDYLIHLGVEILDLDEDYVSPPATEEDAILRKRFNERWPEQLIPGGIYSMNPVTGRFEYSANIKNKRDADAHMEAIERGDVSDRIGSLN